MKFSFPADSLLVDFYLIFIITYYGDTRTDPKKESNAIHEIFLESP
jgi:hypothetical protein